MSALTAIHVEPGIDLRASPGGRALLSEAESRGVGVASGAPADVATACALVWGAEAARAAAKDGYAQIAALARDDRDELLTAGAEWVAADPAEIFIDAPGRLRLKTLNGIPRALDAFGEIERRLGGRRAAVFLDYDGTLAEIVENPADALLSESMKAAVEALAEACKVSIVSGRDLEDVRALVGIDGLHYAGSHGFVMAGPGGWRETAPEGAPFPPVLDVAARLLSGELADLEGVVVERKSFSLAVHHRNAAAGAEARVEAALERLLEDEPRLASSAGKKVFDVKPRVDWDKGRATLALIRRFGEGLSPIYIGDDTTDEDAFRALAGVGVTIVVRDGSDRPTAADFALDGVMEVERFIRRLSGRCGGAR